MARKLPPTLSVLGFGASRIGSLNNPSSLRASERLVRAAMEMGITAIDTASIYGQGDSERTIGRAIAGRRDEVFLVTKGARSFSARYGLLRPLKPLIRPLLTGLGKGWQAASARRDGALMADWSTSSIATSLDASLRRLSTDRVDAYLLHSPPPDVAGDPAVGRVLTELRASGKALRVGISCDDLATLAAALRQDTLDVVELPWDVIEAAADLGDALRARGTIVLAREVIARQPALAPAEALRRSLTHPGVDCTLVGTTRLAHLQAAARIAGETTR
jgi:aryl-alcohol dehydrogenase-like predicted oxidoreductase